MYCTRNVTQDLVWVGADDRRLSMFEGVYSVPRGVSYNSYLLLDDVTVLFDTVDKAVSKVFFENLSHALHGRKLNYVVVQHMEPDHSATLQELLLRSPETVVVCNAKTKIMIEQFFTMEFRAYVVDESKTLSTGHHEIHFVNAPMVHWPEVMVSYDAVDKTLFSADAFGTFGALNGSLFADEVDFARDYLDEARRYYCNIVGKYGVQVQALLKKAAKLDIARICPLHGFVWRKNLGDFLGWYQAWSTYTPEQTGVVIAYASVYGNTENAANIIACRLRELGIVTKVFDVSVTPASEIIAAAFQYSHLVFASTTYNAGIFVTMEELLHDLAAHNIQNRTVALLENGSWAPTSGGLMQKILASCKNMTILEPKMTIRSSLKASQEGELEQFVSAIAATVPRADAAPADVLTGNVDASSMFKLSYGLFVLTAKDGNQDNGCIINTAQQLTSNPMRISIAVNKQNHTHDMILKTGVFNVSVLSQNAQFATFRRFGFQSGRDTDKFAGTEIVRTANGLAYWPDESNAVISGKVVQSIDCGTHTLFIADVTEAVTLCADPSVTYAYYFAHIKPKPQPVEEKKVGWVCKICGYVYEGETLPDDFICPLCKHGAADFERL